MQPSTAFLTVAPVALSTPALILTKKNPDGSHDLRQAVKDKITDTAKTGVKSTHDSLEAMVTNSNYPPIQQHLVSQIASQIHGAHGHNW
ncbi:hypothetical protein IWQ60_004080 [Tieghemiomyces parasiticus]|uniref:Uncharacterized protein n=1 Tax=Tieghemiomyces parasiticus TaxID=78921 RepID=A0A9W8A8X3_9FUNG|nr:hypothetical protein IWQ60_004080 [Tieghemiomyces parasiticus]